MAWIGAHKPQRKIPRVYARPRVRPRGPADKAWESEARTAGAYFPQPAAACAWCGGRIGVPMSAGQVALCAMSGLARPGPHVPGPLPGAPLNPQSRDDMDLPSPSVHPVPGL